MDAQNIRKLIHEFIEIIHYRIIPAFQEAYAAWLFLEMVELLP